MNSDDILNFIIGKYADLQNQIPRDSAADLILELWEAGFVEEADYYRLSLIAVDSIVAGFSSMEGE